MGGTQTLSHSGSQSGRKEDRKWGAITKPQGPPHILQQVYRLKVPRPTKIVPPTWEQVFTHVRLWGQFTFKLQQRKASFGVTVSEVLVLCSRKDTVEQRRSLGDRGRKERISEGASSGPLPSAQNTQLVMESCPCRAVVLVSSQTPPRGVLPIS